MRRRDLSKLLMASATGALSTSAPADTPTGEGAPGVGRHPRSAAEITHQIEPKDDTYPPGSVLRYGADPSGVADSSRAWSDAIRSNSHVFDDYPGGGRYLLGSEVVISRSPITISGSARHIGGAAGGTILTLARSAGAGKALMRTTAFASCVRIEKIRFAWQALNTGQYGLRFAELRASKILDCAFVGSHAPDTTVVGIRFDGSGTFTGDVTVRGNYFSGVLCGIDLQGVCTSVRILENELYGYVSQAQSYGIRGGPRSTETAIAFNMLEGWTVGIETSGGYVKQIANTYEVNGTNFHWMRGAGNNRIWNMSVAEAFVSGGEPVYPLNDIDLCMVLSGPGMAILDAMSINARRGFFAYGRAVREGDWTTEAFSPGYYSADNSGAWSVASERQAALEYTRIGHTMIVNFRVESSEVHGRPHRLFIRLPEGERALKAAASTCLIHDGGGGIGKTLIEAGAGNVAIAKANDEAFNDGPFACRGSVTFECS